MRRRALHTALTGFAAAGLLAAGGALADPTAPVPAPQQRVWFTCDGQTTKVSNVNEVAGDGVPGWDTTAPTGSVTGGAGCGNVDPAFLISTVEDTNQADGGWTGTFTGNLDAVTVELHSIYVGTARATPGYAVTPRLFVDGAPVPLSVEDVEVVPERSATGASEKVVFTLSDLGIVETDDDGNPVPGASDLEHTVTLQVNGTYLDGSPVNGWVWDSTEVPAGLTFNPATPTGPVVRAAR